jgi:hypothetical protein
MGILARYRRLRGDYTPFPLILSFCAAYSRRIVYAAVVARAVSYTRRLWLAPHLLRGVFAARHGHCLMGFCLLQTETLSVWYLMVHRVTEIVIDAFCHGFFTMTTWVMETKGIVDMNASQSVVESSDNVVCLPVVPAVEHYMPVAVLRAVLRAFQCASEDVTRSHIGGVYVHRSPIAGSVFVVSTNGWTMARTRFDAPELFAMLPEKHGVMFARETMPVIKAILKDQGKIGGVRIMPEGSGIVVRSISGLVVSAARTDLFPDYTQVMPLDREDTFSIGLNPDLLIALADAIRDNPKKKGSAVGITLHFGDELSPVVIRTLPGESCEAIGVIMPMRL